MLDSERRVIQQVATAIVQGRTAGGLSREHLARSLSEKLGEAVPLEQVSAWELGRSLPRYGLLPAIESACHLPSGTLARFIWPDLVPAETRTDRPAVVGRIASAALHLDDRRRRLVLLLAEALAEPAADMPEEPEQDPSPNPLADPVAAERAVIARRTAQPRTRAVSPKRHPLRSGKRNFHLEVDELHRHLTASGKTTADVAAAIDLPLELVERIVTGTFNPVQRALAGSLAYVIGVPPEWIEVPVEYPPVEKYRRCYVHSGFLTSMVELMCRPTEVADDDSPRWRRVPWVKDDLLARAGIPLQDWEAIERDEASLTLESAYRLGQVMGVTPEAYLLDPRMWALAPDPGTGAVKA